VGNAPLSLINRGVEVQFMMTKRLAGGGTKKTPNPPTRKSGGGRPPSLAVDENA